METMSIPPPDTTTKGTESFWVCGQRLNDPFSELKIHWFKTVPHFHKKKKKNV